MFFEVRLRDFELHRPRQWGACWLFTLLWKELGLEEFWRPQLGCSGEGTDRPKGRLGKLEADLLGLDWRLAREGVEVN